MTHEFISILRGFQKSFSQNLKTVLATVVELDGSSYRGPGVRMLLLENGEMIGAVSGGCVEKEVFNQSLSVFESGHSKIITYDGRYRLGCEGILYILIEIFNPDEDTVQLIEDEVNGRRIFDLITSYTKNTQQPLNGGTIFRTNGNKRKPLSPDVNQEIKTFPECERFIQKMLPVNQLIIIGTEHDAVSLCSLAKFAGWQVIIIASPRNSIDRAVFSEASYILELDDFKSIQMDGYTAVVFMTHNYARDINFLGSLKSKNPFYIGLLGASERKEKIVSHLIENNILLDLEILEKLHGPAGLNIGAETPQEIAISIFSEILAVQRKKSPIMLCHKEGKIHA